VRTGSLLLLTIVVAGCGNANVASAPLDMRGMPVAARFVVATYLHRSCREARALQRDVDAALPCFDGTGQLPVRHSGRLSRPCALSGGLFGPSPKDAKRGCAFFTVVSRRPNESMSHNGARAYTYASGTLALFVTAHGGRWFVANPFYNGSICAGTRRDCAAEEHLWRLRARPSAAVADLLASST
jgi:hypothetical protein